MDVCQNIEDFYLHKPRIDIIIDYVRCDGNEVVKDWLLSSRIWVIFWPTYSPTLNLIEGSWRCLKKRVISNTSDEAFSEFTGAISIISRTQSHIQAVDGNEITVLRRDVVQ